MYVAKSHNVSRRLFKERVPYKTGSGYTYLAKGRERVRFGGVKKLVVTGQTYESVKTKGLLLPKTMKREPERNAVKVRLAAWDATAAAGYKFGGVYELFEEGYDDFELMNCYPSITFQRQTTLEISHCR